MKTMMITLKCALGAALFIAFFATLSNAQCMKFNVSKQDASLLKPQTLSNMISPPAFAPVAYGSEHEDRDADQDPFVGFWYVTFASDTRGVFFDWAYVQNHSDGLEMMNSGSVGPSAFCMGVWKRTGHLKYKVNHFPIPYNGQTLAGVIHLREEITVSGDHNKFSGRFSEAIYTPTGALVDPPGVFQGNIEGYRITVDTPVTKVLPTAPPGP